MAFKRSYIIDSDAKVQVLFGIDQLSLKDYQIYIILTFKAKGEIEKDAQNWQTVLITPKHRDN